MMYLSSSSLLSSFLLISLSFRFSLMEITYCGLILFFLISDLISSDSNILSIVFNFFFFSFFSSAILSLSFSILSLTDFNKVFFCFTLDLSILAPQFMQKLSSFLILAPQLVQNSSSFSNFVPQFMQKLSSFLILAPQFMQKLAILHHSQSLLKEISVKKLIYRFCMFLYLSCFLSKKQSQPIQKFTVLIELPGQITGI